MLRPGIETESGPIYVLNNPGNQWRGTSGETMWIKQKFKLVAWDGHDPIHADERTADDKGSA